MAQIDDTGFIGQLRQNQLMGARVTYRIIFRGVADAAYVLAHNRVYCALTAMENVADSPGVRLSDDMTNVEVFDRALQEFGLAVKDYQFPKSVNRSQ